MSEHDLDRMIAEQNAIATARDYTNEALDKMTYLEKGRAWRIARYDNGKVEYFYHYNVSVKDAKEIIRGLIKDDLTDDSIDANSFGYEYGQKVDGAIEWSEWYNDESGQDIMEIIDEEDESI